MQVLSNHGLAATPSQTAVRRLFKSKKPNSAPPLSGTQYTSHLPAAGPQESPGRSRRPHTPRRSQTAYFVYLLVGVHHSYAEAKLAYTRLKLAERLPVMYERNENGAGKCKTWLAVSHPFDRRALAEAAQRQLALYAGNGAVSVRRGIVK